MQSWFLLWQPTQDKITSAELDFEVDWKEIKVNCCSVFCVILFPGIHLSKIFYSLKTNTKYLLSTFLHLKEYVQACYGIWNVEYLLMHKCRFGGIDFWKALSSKDNWSNSAFCFCFHFWINTFSYSSSINAPTSSALSKQCRWKVRACISYVHFVQSVSPI